jgi:hypothetical protein
MFSFPQLLPFIHSFGVVIHKNLAELLGVSIAIMFLLPLLEAKPARFYCCNLFEVWASNRMEVIINNRRI